nr:GTP binding protein Parf [Hymenolepis microstoma]
MSIFKKIFSRDSLSNGVLSNGSFCALKPDLQEKLSSGVKYNLKVVIRGERKTGKSSLLSRLTGESFSSNYTPTDEIKVACILWNYQPTNTPVKIDVWDVVDKGRQREVKHGNISNGYISKLTKRNQTATAMASLDSSFIDVYKGANCVILIFDLTNKVTFEYVRRELPRVPYSVPVLVIGNFRDAAAVESGGRREIPESDVRDFIQRANKARQAAVSTITPSDDLVLSDLRKIYMCAPIRYCEASMLNGFGLMYIHRFLTIPFLHLQSSYLIQGLVANRQAFNDSCQHLDLAEENQEFICSYEKFTRWLESSRSQAFPKNPPPVHQVQTAIKSVESKPLKSSSTKEPVVGKTEPVSNVLWPSNTEEDRSFHDFLNAGNGNSPSHSITDKPSSVYANVDSKEPLTNAVPEVAAFQEDLDPDDTAEHLAALSFGLNGSTASPPPPVLQTADSSMDDVDDDDDDLMNEDSDDDEEHLGPALGLTSPSTPPPVANGNDLSSFLQLPHQKPQLSALQSTSICLPSSSSSSSSSCSISKRFSLEVDSAASRRTSNHPSPKASVDLTTAEDLNAFERFLDDPVDCSHLVHLLSVLYVTQSMHFTPIVGALSVKIMSCVLATLYLATQKIFPVAIPAVVKWADNFSLGDEGLAVTGFPRPITSGALCRGAIPGLVDCSTPSSQGKYIDASVVPCNEDPCVLKRGHNTSINIQFTPTELVKGGKIVVHGIIRGIPVPFPLPDNNLCHFLKSGCNAQPNVPTEMDYSLYVKESYPPISVEIKWQLVDDLGVDLVCIKFPAKLQSASHTVNTLGENLSFSKFPNFRRYMADKVLKLYGKWFEKSFIYS